ncbi:MAG TPA: Hpt domain-containing protein [Pirellulales bacterium]|nr:Hpt domain-containing protein [Pirellulales bacterium]
MKAQLHDIAEDPLPRSLLIDLPDSPPRGANGTAGLPPRSSAAPTEEQELAALNIKELERRCMGRIEFAERLLASFEQRFPIETAEITESFERTDLARLTRLVHQLKGSTANIGAVALNRLLQQIEKAIQYGNLADFPEWLDRLNREWQRFLNVRRSLEKTNTV